MALPYAQDAGVTRHLAAFLTRQARALATAHDAPVAGARPGVRASDGGAVQRRRVQGHRAQGARARGAQRLAGGRRRPAGRRSWKAPTSIWRWRAARPTTAGCGQGHGLRIRGGTARAYYVGVETAMPAVPGHGAAGQGALRRALRHGGRHAGRRAAAGVRPGRRRADALPLLRQLRPPRRPVGTMLDDVAGNDELEELAPIETTLPAQQGNEGKLVPVNLQAAVTEIGTLELRCLERGGPGPVEARVQRADEGVSGHGVMGDGMLGSGCGPRSPPRLPSSCACQPLHRRHRPRHHQLRRRLRRPVARGRRRRSWTSPSRSCSGPAKWRRGRCCPPASTSPASTNCRRVRPALPWGESPECIVGEFARWQGARVPGTAGGLGQELAVPRRRGPLRADPAVGRAGGGGQALAGGGLGAAARAPGRGVESRPSRRAAGRRRRWSSPCPRRSTKWRAR